MVCRLGSLWFALIIYFLVSLEDSQYDLNDGTFINLLALVFNLICSATTRIEPSLPQPKRFRFDNSSAPFSINSTLDSTSSALLIDRMFAHLSRETEVMREWVNLERERLAQEIVRRKEEKEREERREKSFLQVLTKLQDQVFNFLSKQHSSYASCPSQKNATTPSDHLKEQ